VVEIELFVSTMDRLLNKMLPGFINNTLRRFTSNWSIAATGGGALTMKERWPAAFRQLGGDCIVAIVRLEPVGGHQLNLGMNGILEALGSPGNHTKGTTISRCEGWRFRR
jgi:hypothetical protein